MVTKALKGGEVGNPSLKNKHLYVKPSLTKFTQNCQSTVKNGSNTRRLYLRLWDGNVYMHGKYLLLDMRNLNMTEFTFSLPKINPVYNPVNIASCKCISSCENVIQDLRKMSC